MEQDVVAVFPLPNVVFFPHTDLPLHIFEPRYCQMVEDTIQNRQMIGMFLLQPGWQDDYYGNPPIYSVGCAGELIKAEALPDGKFNIVLRGVARVRAMETIQESPYRKVRVHILPEVTSKSPSAVNAMKRSLLADFQAFSRHTDEAAEEISRKSEFAAVVNAIASNLSMDPEEKRRLLEMGDVYDRAVAVQNHLSAALAVLKLTSAFSHLRPTDPNVN
jgi:uncharacterized protein